MLIINHDHIHDYPHHYHYPSSIILIRTPHLVVLVGKAEPLVKGNGAVAVLVNSLELVGRASLDCDQVKGRFHEEKKMIILKMSPK